MFTCIIYGPNLFTFFTALCSYGCNECDSPSLCTDCVIGYDLVPINPSNAFCEYGKLCCITLIFT